VFRYEAWRQQKPGFKQEVQQVWKERVVGRADWGSVEG
jgi:hypothetical protein